MYTQKVSTQEEAICHLFFHCCFKDDRFTRSELDVIAGKLVSIGLHDKLNFRDEASRYRSYEDTITDEAAYVQFLLQVAKPVNELALYSYCLELCLADAELSVQEEKLLDAIAAALNIATNERAVISRLAVQRKVVETQKLF